MKEQGKRWAMSQLQDPVFQIKATGYGKLEAALSARTPDGERITHEMRPADALIDCELRLERTTKLVKTKALPIHDNYGAWCVLVYDKANHPEHVILLD